MGRAPADAAQEAGRTAKAAVERAAGAGQDESPSSEMADAMRKTSMSLREIIIAGGWVMYPIAALSVIGLALVIYFAIVLRVGQVAPRRLLRELVEHVRAGRMADARRICEYSPNPLSAISLAAIDHLRDLPNADPLVLKDIMQGEGQRQAEAIQGQTQYLMDVGVIAPMLGLFGTVVGMLRAFSSIALDIARAKPIVLAAGVSQALVTTVFGLMVAIPAMVAYAYFRRRASKLTSLLEVAATEMLTVLLSARKP
jgi:biopolymer transport protein ExbB